jgi:hypothetical protein
LTLGLLLYLEIAGLLVAAVTLQGRDTSSALLREVGEEIEVGITGDLGMLGKELRELRVAAGDVFLVGEKRGVGLEDLRENGAHAKEREELFADCDELLVGWGSYGCRDGGRGRLRLREGGGREWEEKHSSESYREEPDGAIA